MTLAQKGYYILKNEGITSLLQRGTAFIGEWGIKWLVAELLWFVLPESKIKYQISKSRLLTTLFFYIRGSFYHEQRAILRGKIKYNRFEKQRSNPNNRLIKYTHQLEKGLSMRDRRDVFAEEYIGTLVTDVITAWNTEERQLTDEQLYWSIDVLTTYFTATDDTEIIAEAEQRFAAFRSGIKYEPKDRTPRPRREIERETVSYEEIKRLAEQRSSTRWFQPREVPRERIDDAIQVAAKSPSACNRQSYEYRVYDDPELLDEILQPPLGISGFKSNIPSLVVLTGKQRAYRRDQEKNVVFVDASLSAMAFQFALESMGLASCTINWPAVPSEDRRVRRLLNLDDDEIVITLMAVGYPDPDGKVPYSKKRNLDQIRSYNRH